ncbi:hypothetical protein [Vibrio sp. 070316B]|uniref:hypothetical protein n=1 Tax=Vibrio sp. 070316B TaxID=2607608 RepID=UPI0020A3B210|nr:hypothetical protein [Vibrio sp. 070316B]
MSTLEICRVQVRDIVKKNGQLAKCFSVQGEVSRDFYLSNIKLQNLIKSYIERRKKMVIIPTYTTVLMLMNHSLSVGMATILKSSIELQRKVILLTTVML